MQSYPPRALDRRLQEDWARDAREDPKVLMSLRTHLLIEVASPLSLPSPFRCHSSSKKQKNPLMKKILGLQAPLELTSLVTYTGHTNSNLQLKTLPLTSNLIGIRNLNPEVALHSMLLALRPDKFANSLCKKPLVAWTSCVNEPKATSRWKKCSDSEMKSDKLDKSMTSKKEAPRTYSHKLNKRHKLDKRQPLPKRPRYEHYTPLIANRTTILKESFNLEVPIRLPPTKPPRPGLDTTKYYRYNRDIHHNTKDC
ncbi:hypothetical protein HKD37_U058344 [Glycine soja]